MSPKSSWRWSRWIARDQEPPWSGELASTGGSNWMIVDRPGWKRLKLEAYFSNKREARVFEKRWGGRVDRFAPRPAPPSAPIRVDARLEIGHDERAPRAPGRLIIPYGTAFGSGEHATTFMLLRMVAKMPDLAERPVLDLGTGSGVLALAARAFGAASVAATDFDPAAIVTARRNERLNFSSRRIRWEVADVKTLRGRSRYGLIVANLFSGILVETAPRLARALGSGGELWISGVLRSQQEEVGAAFKRAGLEHLATKMRGKWVMQRWGR